jgi:hypothetical protein
VPASLRTSWTALWTSRVLVWLSGMGAVWIWGLSERAPGFDPTGIGAATWTAPAVRWDAIWFLGIARGGYDDGPTAAFFPLYPLGVGVLGGSVVAGILVSLVAFGAALWALERLTELELGADAARWTVWALAFSPMAFFFSAVYSESLFLALTVGSVLCARRDHWVWAGILGALAAATRSTGIAVVLALVLLAFANGHRPKVSQLVWVLLVPLGLAAFPIGLALAHLNWHAPFDAQDVWFREWAGPLGGVWDGAKAAWAGVRQLAAGDAPGTRLYFPIAGGDPLAIARINIGLFLWVPLVVIALIGAVRRLPLGYAAYVVASLAVPLSYPVVPQPLMSFPRFVLVCFPLWMWFGWLLSRHKRWRIPVLVVSAILLAVTTAQFATWHFVA